MYGIKALYLFHTTIKPKAMKIKNKNIGTVEAILKGEQVDTDIDLGSISLKLEGREFILDVVQSFRNYDEDDDTTSIEMVLEIDKKTFPDCKFDLQTEDLLREELYADIYLRLDEMEHFVSATLSVAVDGEEKEITLKLDE